jgi:hypothetical protein
MSGEQPMLWDYLGRLVEEHTREEVRARNERRAAQRRHLKKMRASGHWQTVLKVARQLRQPFTLNDLSVACWEHDHEFFGMKGYPQHPDNHKIHTFLYGKRGLIHNGLLLRVEEGLFRVPGEEPVPAACEQANGQHEQAGSG